MQSNKTLTKITKNLPEAPGVYRMKDETGKIIYVGKAKSLRNRVRSYFLKDYAHSTRTRKMVEKIADIEFTQTDSELEALLLETNLIKELRPRYNILMKDDKSYVYIRIDMGEDYPRIRVVREHEVHRLDRKPRGSKVRYFGPKLASSRVYETLRFFKKLFPHRHCGLDIKFTGTEEERNSPNLQLVPKKELVEVTNRVIDYPCLDYFIKRCSGPCIGAISPVEYKKIVQQIVDFLDGKSDELENSLKAQMAVAAGQKQFEKAAKIRDKLKTIESMTERQKITDPNRKDTDIINFVAEMEHVYFNIFMVRDGKLTSQENFVLDAFEMKSSDNPGENPIEFSEVIESFLLQYYAKAGSIPREILVPEDLEGREAIEAWLSKEADFRVTILTPQKGKKNKLLELSKKNALQYARQFRIKWMAAEEKSKAVERLAVALHMKDKILHRIEGYDISHLGGNETVGSMVVFEDGMPKSAHYRHFKLRTVSGKPDDYRSMEEVLTRRLKYLQKNDHIRFAKARKKDADLIKEWGIKLNWKELIETPDWQNFYLLKDQKIPIGMARLLEVKPGIFMIESVYIIPEYRGGLLSFVFMQKLIGRIKNKKARLYISVEDHLLEHWMTFGFTEVRTAPEEVMARNTFFEKLDNTTYTVLAYYVAQKKKVEDPSFSARPDLLVIDGGKGQLAEAVKVLAKLKLTIPVISLAKRLEEIYIPGFKAPILLEEGEEALKLLQRIRDESHRFAITFQRNLHRKSIVPGLVIKRNKRTR